MCSYCCSWAHKLIVNNKWPNSSTTSNYSVLILVTQLVQLVQLRQEVAAVQILLEHQVVLLRVHSHISLVASSSTHAVGKALTLILVKYEAWGVNIWVTDLKLDGIIRTRCSLALEISHLHNIVMLPDKLLIRRICCCYNYLSSAGVSSCKALLKACLASTSDGLLSSRMFMVVLLRIALVCNRMSHRVDIKVAKLLLVRYFYVAFVVKVREHAVF